MKTIALTILLLLTLTVYGQQNATTDDGKKILLKSDGTWEYVTSTPTVQTNGDGFDFRKTTWGMSKEKVKQAETAKLEKDNGDLLIYSGVVSSMNVLIVYIFVDNQLVRAKYTFLEEHTNKNDYISDYKSINSALTEKYGNPNSDKEYWNNDLYKDDYDKKGFAVSMGHLKYYASWETAITEITAALTGDNYKIRHVTEYVSKKLSALEDQKKKEKNKSDF